MDSFQTQDELTVQGHTYRFHSLPKLAKRTGVPLSRFPYSHRILIENLLRHEDGDAVTKADLDALLTKDPRKESDREIQFTPSRVLLQDFTGVPVVADLAAMRDAMVARGQDPQKVNPLRPVDLVIDHSVQMDFYGEPDALVKNHRLEFERNQERYRFLKWGQKAFQNFRVVPPATGICHQINLEFLSQVAMVSSHGNQTWIYPDTLVGTDSHTTMINGLGVLGWGVGGIEAEAAMLGQPCTMLIPQVIGFEMKGSLRPGVTATDLVLTCTHLLRKHGVVGQFVEFFGEGVRSLSIADRATVSNMSPEYGATIGIFAPDNKVLEYLRATGRHEQAERTEAYFKAQDLWDTAYASLNYSDVLSLDLDTVEPVMAGPSRPQDRARLSDVRKSFRRFLISRYGETLKDYTHDKLAEWAEMSESMKSISFDKASFHPSHDLGPLHKSAQIVMNDKVGCEISHGSIVLASITSCTNTSNPDLMIAAALLARNAVQRGLSLPPWVKTSFAPGSLAVRDYLQASGLMPYLEQVGFQIAGFGCATCIGNSGPLPEPIQAAIEKEGLATVSVLSGNRNFEARIHPFVMANYLASPPLVVAAALCGNINVDLSREPLAINDHGEAIYLRDIWPDAQETRRYVERFVTPDKFEKVYSDVFQGDRNWQTLQSPESAQYQWSQKSTYIKRPPFLDPEIVQPPTYSKPARILAIFGDSITTDHISPAGGIGAKSPAGQYLLEHSVASSDFNSYGSRRGNHEVMLRGTFANVRIRNKMASKEGGYTKVYPNNEEMTFFEAANFYAERKIPLVVFAGQEYGSGSSRDWAAKGTRLLGVQAVVAESFERIHRSNLVGMGVVPLQLEPGLRVSSLDLRGDEEIEWPFLENLQPKKWIELKIRSPQKGLRTLRVQVRIDTPNEMRYSQAGGILPYVLERLQG